LIGITSQKINDIKETEFLIEESSFYFKQTGLAKTSVVRCEYVMTIPAEIIAKKLGVMPNNFMQEINKRLRLSIGLSFQSAPEIIT